ncbi:hypothetical protein [Emticicia sp. TH156]|uniref:hypothetical protein n=1 Tax=Emticicia sp. TH156 TaxID=2067454 RepID=UPI000C76F838|nr:hypothetical protein [Emticicia sp. TH156]PLK42102.1 hypothetical protein C0V77_22575 [Emticicia sp. TH156]
MKLSKAKLIKLVKPKLLDLGFTEFRETTEGTQGFFVKKLRNELYLSLGLIKHRYYESAFTGAFYLSKTTRWASLWGDIPSESYKRPGYLLTDEERSIYPENELNTKGTYDIWWNGNDEKSVLDFLRVIELTEPRLLNHFGLIQKIEQSQEVQTLSNYSEAVKKIVSSNQINGSFSFLPPKEVDEIPIIWFKASEKVLKESKGIVNLNTVKLLATDAYRQKQLDIVSS